MVQSPLYIFNLSLIWVILNFTNIIGNFNIQWLSNRLFLESCWYCNRSQMYSCRNFLTQTFLFRKKHATQTKYKVKNNHENFTPSISLLKKWFNGSGHTITVAPPKINENIYDMSFEQHVCRVLRLVLLYKLSICVHISVCYSFCWSGICDIWDTLNKVVRRHRGIHLELCPCDIELCWRFRNFRWI